MKRFLISFACIVFINSSFAQKDNVGAGRTIFLDGVDDFVSYGDVYHSVNLPFTVSAWVYLDPTSGVNPIFCTNDNPVVYRGFIFFITPTTFGCEFGDGTGGNNPAYRRGKIANIPNVFGRWIHVCAVMTAPFTIDLYINGINVGGNSSGESNLPMASSIPGDIAKSGFYISNSSTYRFKGMIDEVRLWNRSLTQDEVRRDMCKKIKGNETGLIGYWDFDETTGKTVSDKSPNGFNGQINGNPSRIFSGAPIGDDSKFLYTANWLGNSILLLDGDDQVIVNNVQGSPEGIQIYEVKNQPSQTSGLPVSSVTQPYYGVFVASLHTNNTVNASYLFKGSQTCQTFSRSDNSVSTWINSANPSINILQRTELIKASGQKIDFDLGADKVVCDQASVTLSTGVTDPQVTFLWSTGETTESINVTQNGKYTVGVSGDCGSVSDDITIGFAATPSIFLGKDSSFCQFNPIKLKPVLINASNYSYVWQDGSTMPTFVATDFGKYWVSVKNFCGTDYDTILFSKDRSIGFDLGPDKLICNHISTQLSVDINQPGVTFQWANGQTGPVLTVTKSGTYSVKAFSPCMSQDSIKVTFQNSPPSISLGSDEVLCVFKPIELKPINDASSFQLTWQDNSTSLSYKVTDFGKYWVSVKNDCGIVSDTIIFTKYKGEIGFLPNVITPNNGDELNQYFKVDETLIGNVSLLVMNRWGKVVYQSSSYMNDWSGGDLSAGTYYVVIQGSCIEETKDWLTILH